MPKQDKGGGIMPQPMPLACARSISGKPALVMDLKYKIRQRFPLPDLIKANHHIIDDRATIAGAFYNADKGARATL